MDRGVWRKAADKEVHTPETGSRERIETGAAADTGERETERGGGRE